MRLAPRYDGAPVLSIDAEPSEQLPLGLRPAHEPDELVSRLRYAAVVGPILGIAIGQGGRVRLAIESSDPDERFVVDVGEDVALHAASVDPDLPLLHGDAAELVEMLSLRAPLRPEVPVEWHLMLDSLRAAFDQ